MTSLGDGRDIFGHEILVFHRSNGVMHAHHRADFIHAVTTGVHDDIGVDRTLVCFNSPGVVSLLH